MKYYLRFIEHVASRKKFFFLLICAFFFRLWYGLCSAFWLDDEKQIYLIGLKFYTTGAWPYFGPDTHIDTQAPGTSEVIYQAVQTPGALQGVLVGSPFWVLPIPEAPFLLLNVLSFLSLCLLAWYCTSRLPEMPRWFIWAWLLTSPWTLNYSTHVVNISYVLPGAILFFIAVLETCPYTSANLIPLKWANFMMGFSLFWVMQVHLSWPILLPYIVASFYFQYRFHRKCVLASFGWFAFGAVLTGSLVLPTYLQYGLGGGSGGSGSAAVLFNTNNLPKLFRPVEGIWDRFLSFASFELPRFIGNNSVRRIEFIKGQLWLAPFILFLGVVGILQPLAMVILWFFKSSSQKDWKAIKFFTLLTVLLLYVGFLFSARAPFAHLFYLTLPVAMIYSFYCWSRFLSKKRWQTFAKVFIICGIIFHIGLAINHLSHTSLYLNRSIPQAAIEMKDYRMLGERRPGARY